MEGETGVHTPLSACVLAPILYLPESGPRPAFDVLIW